MSIVFLESTRLNSYLNQAELGNVVFDEDGSSLEFLEKQLDMTIYDSLRRFITSWKKSFPEF